MKKKKLNIKKLILFFIILLVFILLGIAGFILYELSPVDKKAKIESYEVALGKGVYEVYEDLEVEGFIRSALALKIYSKIKGSTNIDAGVFEISKSYGSLKIYNILNEKNTLNADDIKLVFVDGQDFNYLVKIAVEATDLNEEDFYSAMSDQEYIKSLIDSYWFLTDDILDENIYYPLEGYLFPNTYNIYKDSSAKDIIERLLEGTKNKLETLKEDFEKSSLSIHEVMTLASLVELEGYNLEDKYSIAGVFMNRINNDWLLQSDPTTYYGSKIPRNTRELTRSELNDCTNKYNTSCQSNIGLPVGPIANAGLDSIKASLNPEEHNYYYFVSDKYRNIYLNKTYNDHVNTVNRLQSEGLWYNYD